MNKKIFKKSQILLRVIKISYKLRPKAVIGYLSGAGLEVGGTIVGIYATAQLGNLLATYIQGKPTDRIWYWFSIDMLAAAMIGLGFWAMSTCNRLLYFSVVQWSSKSYLEKLSVIDYPDFYKASVRNLINKVDNGFVWRMAELSGNTMELLYGIIRLIVIGLVVVQVNLWLIPILIIFLIPSLIAESRQAGLLWFVWDSQGDERHIFWGILNALKLAKAQMEIRSMQAKDYLTNKVVKMNKHFYNEQEKEYRLASKPVLASKLFEVGGIAVGTVILIRRFINGTIGFNQYLFLSGALLRINGAMNTVFGTLTRVQEPLLYAENFFELIDLVPQEVDKPGAVALSKTIPTIKFENLSFRYPGSEHYVFQDLNLEIKPGQHIAIVGENGVGKSTLIKLLMRFYRPEKGRILIDGNDINDIEINSWYKKIATLFQDFNRYPFSIKENITLQEDKDINEPSLNKVAKISGVEGFSSELPNNLNTVLDSSFAEGVEPSGGQYQRVALARAFYRDAGVLILDEPTAAIDAKAEYEIFNNIFKEYKDKTTIIVSHRFSTVRRADRIIVVEDGKIIEDGTHEELMKHNGLYKEMFNKQAEGYR